MQTFDVAYHEAGHAVIAIDEGIELGSYIEAGVSRGIALYDPSFMLEKLGGNDLHIWGPKYIKMLLAGRAAQERYAKLYCHVLFESDEGWAVDDNQAMQIATKGLGWVDVDDQLTMLRKTVKSRVEEDAVDDAVHRIVEAGASAQGVGKEHEFAFA